MLKKIAVNHLRPGMFIVDLNSGWLGHPFIRNKFRLSAEDIPLINASGIHEVTIDTSRGLDAEAPSLESIEEQEVRQLKKLARVSEADAPPPSPPGDEARARIVVEHAIASIRDVMNDARLGKPVDISVLTNVASQVAREVIGNPAITLVLYRLYKSCEYTFAHCLRVAVLSVSCAHRMGLSAETCQNLALGGILHDIGKMRVRQDILQKPGRLEPDELEHMREHVAMGAALVGNRALPEEALAVLMEHHERYDGNGYPGKLKGEEISLAGRIAAVADVYDAISSDRWYNQALPPAAAIRKIYEWSRYYFDANVTAHFIRSVGIYPVGSLVRLSTNRLAIVVEHQPSQPLRPRVLPVFDLRSKRLLSGLPEIDLAVRRHIRIEDYEDPSEWGIDPAEYL